MDDYYSDNQPRLIHCKFCGEDYAATYKACPFCHTAPNGKKVGSRSGRNSRAGNRVRTNTRGGGYGGARSPLSIIGIILSIVLLVAAVVIVVVLVRSVLSGNDTPATNSSANITSSQQADGSGEPGAASQSSQSAEPQTVAPDSVSLDQTSATLNSGETVTLTGPGHLDHQRRQCGHGGFRRTGQLCECGHLHHHRLCRRHHRQL